MSYLLAGVLVMMAVTILLRLAPFFILGRIADTPLAHFLRVMMPAGVMMILVFYSLSSVDFRSPPYGVPSLLAVLVTGMVHHWRRNPLLSIICGTASYVLLVNVFS